MVCVNLTHCIFGELRSPIRTIAISNRMRGRAEASEAPQFGPILRAPIQWVKKASKQWWISASESHTNRDYSIRGHKRVYRYLYPKSSVNRSE